MYGFTNDESGARRNRAFDTENLSMALPPGLEASFPEAAVFRRLVEMTQLVDRRIAQSIQRWTGFFGASLRDGGLGAAPRTLRIAVYNLHARQDAAGRAPRGGVGAADGPSWTLRVHGKLLPEGDEAAVKFSHFVRKLTLELPGKEPGHVVEWHNERLGGGGTDGFELTRPGSRDVRVRVTIDLNYPVPLFALPPSLRALLGGDTAPEVDTLDGVLRGVWLYCQLRSLVVDYESGRLVCDVPLRSVLNVPQFAPEDLAGLVRPLLQPAPPLVVEHTVRVNASPEETMQCFDVTVHEPDAVLASSRAANSILEIDREVVGVVEEVAVLAKRHAALTALARDPVAFGSVLARTQARDEQFTRASESLNELTLHKNPYLEEAAAQYLKRKRARPDGSHQQNNNDGGGAAAKPAATGQQ